MDDDLDAFFDDVENAVKDAEQSAAINHANDDEDHEEAALVAVSIPTLPNVEDNDDLDRHPTKRARTVVASSVPVISIFGQCFPPGERSGSPIFDAIS